MDAKNNQTVGIILFVIIGVSALGLGILNMGKSIGSPMKIDGAVSARVDQAVNSDQAAIDSLKTKDTDGDSLSDYDELFVYHTSPYIKDTDSDSIPDGTEVKSGTDPLCPAGKSCGVPVPVVSNTNQPASGSVIDLNTGAALSSPLQSAIGLAANASQIRQLLKDQGVADSVLDAFSDTDLVTMYNESAGSLTNSASGAGADKAASAATVRDLLKKQGVTDEMLKAFTDDELIKMYNESAGETANSNINQ